MINGVIPRRRIAARTAKPARTRPVEATRSLRRNPAVDPPGTTGDTIQLDTIRRLDETSAARIARPQIKENLVEEAATASVSAFETS